MLYLIGHTKGGVGKTTIATNLAVQLSPLGPVCLVDADEQHHSNRFVTRRLAHPELARIDCHVMSGGLHKPLLTLSKRFANVVVDAGGADSEELRSAARTVDVLLAPFSPSQNDLDGFELLMRKVVRPAYDYHPDLHVFALPNKCETHAKRQDRLPAARAYVESMGFTVLNSRLSSLPAPYNRSTEEGLGLREMRDLSAHRALFELIAVLGEVHSLMAKVVMA